MLINAVVIFKVNLPIVSVKKFANVSNMRSITLACTLYLRTLFIAPRGSAA